MATISANETMWFRNDAIDVVKGAEDGSYSDAVIEEKIAVMLTSDRTQLNDGRKKVGSFLMPSRLIEALVGLTKKEVLAGIGER